MLTAIPSEMTLETRLLRPLLSVIVPVYNVAPYLDQCLGSILSCGYSELEVIVVDDGSTDGSPTLCDAWAERDARLRVIHQPNAGQSAARNRALEQMRGDYFTFVDADDWVAPLAFTRGIAYLEEHPEVGLLELGYAEVSSEQEPKPQLRTSQSLSAREVLALFARMQGPLGMPWGKLFRTALAGHLRFPEGRIYEDTPFVFRALSLSGRYYYMAEVGYYYRVGRPGSSTEHWDGRLTWLFDNLLELRPALTTESPELLPYLYQTLLERLSIFVLWADRHRASAPELLSLLLPYTKELRRRPLLPSSMTTAVRNTLFIHTPRLFLMMKRLCSLRS